MSIVGVGTSTSMRQINIDNWVGVVVEPAWSFEARTGRVPVAGGERGTERAVASKFLPANADLELVVARGDVVEDRIARDMVVRVGLGDVPAAGPITKASSPSQSSSSETFGRTIGRPARRRLREAREQVRVFGRLEPGLLGVRAVVARDADDLRRARRRGQLDIGERRAAPGASGRAGAGSSPASPRRAGGHLLVADVDDHVAPQRSRPGPRAGAVRHQSHSALLGQRRRADRRSQTVLDLQRQRHEQPRRGHGATAQAPTIGCRSAGIDRVAVPRRRRRRLGDVAAGRVDATAATPALAR